MKKIIAVTIVSFVFGNSSTGQSLQSFILNFESGKYDITGIQAKKLDSIILLITQHPIVDIELNGHTDSQGSNAYNDALSLKRVHAIHNYLRKKNVKDSIGFVEKGFGKRQLLKEEKTNDERSGNRRVEMIVHYKDAKILTPLISLEAAIMDSTLKVGNTISLPNLQFEPATTTFLKSSLPVLKELRKVLMDNPRLKIAIEGHICCGPENESELRVLKDNENMFLPKTFKLSEQRAMIVWQYLTQNGINASRLSYKGFGSTDPIYPLPEKTEEERIANRRVEIRIVEK